MFSALSLGLEHACGLQTDQTLVCWDASHQLTVPSGTFRAVSAGFTHDCALTSDGKPVCWGSNLDGQASPPDETFVSIGCGYRHTCATRADGTVACWGKIDPSDGYPSPGMFAASSPEGTFLATSIGSHSCGIRPDGRVECWDQGCDVIQPAMEDTRYFCLPNTLAEVPIPDGPFVSLASNLGSFCGLRPSGAVECWGFDPIPTCRVPQERFTAVAVGSGLGFACGIRASDAGISCWGAVAR
jgi:hypothetical protein